MDRHRRWTSAMAFWAGVSALALVAGCASTPPGRPGGGDGRHAGRRAGVLDDASSPLGASVTTTTLDSPVLDPSGAVPSPTAAPPAGLAGSGPLSPRTPQAATPPTWPTPLSEPNRAAPGGTAAAPDSNALWAGDFPDPYVLRVGAEYYAFATQSNLTQVQTLRSTDLRSWQKLGDALPRLPGWAGFGHVWGPSVLARGVNYVLYYATQVAANGRQCISRAVSLLPQGPYLDTSNGPLICQLDRGGSIDPSPFVDANGAAWLLWKSEGTTAGEPTRLWAQRLAADGQSLTGQATELLHTTLAWEQPIIERPTMTRTADGRYYLLYSANRWETADYAIGWAQCAGPAGPCRRVATTPLLQSHGKLAGPGSPDVFTDVTGQLRVAFHAWTAPYVGYPLGARRLHMAALTFVAGRPMIAA